MTGHIQVGDVAPRVQYVANGSQTVFPYPFPIFAESDLEVWIGAARLAASAYAVAGAGASEGGSVTLAAAPPNAVIVTLRRRLTLRRTSDFHDDGIIRAKVVNDEFDYQTMSVQQVAEDVERAVKRAHTSGSAADLTLPEPLPGRTLKWNAAATGLENSAADPDAILTETTAARDQANRSQAAAAQSAETASFKAATAAAAALAAERAAASAQTLVNITVDSDPALAANSDVHLPPQSAVRAYVGTAIAGANATAQAAAQAAALASVPVGVVVSFAGTAAPSGWVLCNGAAISRTAYAALFAVLGTAHGTGDGATTFNLPDLRGRVPIGVGQGSGLTDRTLGQKLGEENHLLTISEMPSHRHYLASVTNGGQYAGAYNSGSGVSGLSTSDNGGNAAHNTMQPSYGLNFIIKY